MSLGEGKVMDACDGSGWIGCAEDVWPCGECWVCEEMGADAERCSGCEACDVAADAELGGEA